MAYLTRQTFLCYDKMVHNALKAWKYAAEMLWYIFSLCFGSYTNGLRQYNLQRH